METKATVPIPNRIIVMGASAGGLQAITKVVSQLQSNFSVPILIVQHISADATGNVLPGS